MVNKRITPEDDFKRLAERINSNQVKLIGRAIVDKSDFEKAFDEYMDDVELTKSTRLKMLNRSFDFFVDKKAEIGVVIRRRRMTERQDDIIEERIKKRDFVFPGTSGEQVVFARKDSFVFKGKKRIVFRDAKGRFVSVTDEG